MRIVKYGLLLAFVVCAAAAIWTLSSPSERSAGNQEGAFLVVLDPGHGGEDPGAVVGEQQEKDINLAVALQIREQLEDREGIAVVMTRDEDASLTLLERAELANGNQADLFVSVHANSLEDASYDGIMTFCHPDKSSGQAPAKAIQAAVAAATGAADRGVRREDYAVLRETAMPAVLVETGFMTCPQELDKLTDPEYQALLAQGIARGILDYFKQ